MVNIQRSQRFLSLDVLRGLTVAGMILVNNQGSGGSVSFLNHASWDGCTPADLVFPFFLFIVGAAIRFAMKKTNYALNTKIAVKILKRGALIFLVGMLLINYFPFKCSFSELRIPGVMQRIGIVYVVASFLVLALKDYRRIIAAVVALLLGYWALLYFTGGYSVEGNIVGRFDLAVFGDAHMYHRQGVAFDPEGLLSAIPSVANALLGYLFALLLDRTANKTKAVAFMAGSSLALIAVALLWNMVLPFNKPLWSSSFVLYTCGWSALIWSLFAYVIDVCGKRQWTVFLQVFGVNALFAYTFSDVLGMSSWSFPFTVGGVETTVYGWVHDHLLLPFFPGQLCVVLWGLLILLVTWAIAWFLYRRKIYIKL